MIVLIKYWGIGYSNYDNTKTVQENVDILEYKYDIVIAYKPLEMLDFKNVNIPKCIRYNEMFDIDFTKNIQVALQILSMICFATN